MQLIQDASNADIIFASRKGPALRSAMEETQFFGSFTVGPHADPS